MVVIGASMPFTAFCGDCTAGFADTYAADLGMRTGRPVEVINRSRDDSAGMLQIRTQVTEDQGLRDQIAAADVVIVSVGFNNVMPDSSTGVAKKALASVQNAPSANTVCHHTSQRRTVRTGTPYT